MGQTRAGAKKAAATIKAKYGTTPDGKSKLHQQIGAEGGKNGRGHTFGHGKVDPREAGALGGRKSKRGKQVAIEHKPSILGRVKEIIHAG